LESNKTGMKLIGIKYCGGCNPHIDRAKLVAGDRETAAAGIQLTTIFPQIRGIGYFDLRLAQRACAYKPDFNIPPGKGIIVAGSSVDLDNAPEEKTWLRLSCGKYNISKTKANLN